MIAPLSAIGHCLKDAGLEVVESVLPGIFHVANSRTMMTLIITRPAQNETQQSYQKWQQADIQDFSAWEASRWLKKY